MIQVITDIMSQCHQMGLQDTYMVVPAISLSDAQKRVYWQSLSDADTLKYRWADMDNPTVNGVMDAHEGKHNFFVMDCEDGDIVAEFVLCNFLAKTAQVHFSMRPQNDARLSIFLADKVTDHILEDWKQTDDLEENFLRSIYGLTPTDNRVACIFIRKAGFKRVGTLPGGATYFGKNTDAVLTIKTRSH